MVDFDVCYYQVTYVFSRESTLYICLNIKQLVFRNRHDILRLSGRNGIRTQMHVVCKQILKHLDRLPKWLRLWWLLFCTVHLTVSYYHLMWAVWSKSTLFSWLNKKKLLDYNRPNICSLSYSNGIKTHNHLVCKRTLNYLAILVKWLSCVVNAYLCGEFDCILLLCPVRISDWIYT